MIILTFILVVSISAISLTYSVNTNHDPKLTPKLTSTLIVFSVWLECSSAHRHFPKMLLLKLNTEQREGKAGGRTRQGLLWGCNGAPVSSCQAVGAESKSLPQTPFFSPHSKLSSDNTFSCRLRHMFPMLKPTLAIVLTLLIPERWLL